MKVISGLCNKIINIRRKWKTFFLYFERKLKTYFYENKLQKGKEIIKSLRKKKMQLLKKTCKKIMFNNEYFQKYNQKAITVKVNENKIKTKHFHYYLFSMFFLFYCWKCLKLLLIACSVSWPARRLNISNTLTLTIRR